MHKTKRAAVHGFKLLPADEGAEGTFEAIVAVFGNVDHAGDRILPGAFADSLTQWAASGDPIPVLFSHRWDDLDAHIGEVLEAEELGAGDARLPEVIKDLGGLYIKALLHVDEDFAGRVWRKLNRRTLREFSFAYDVVEEATPDQPLDANHRNDLIKLDVIEVGPTLKGCNPVTALIGAKARAAGKSGAADLLDDLGELADLEDIVDGELIERALETLGQAAGTELENLEDGKDDDDLDGAPLELPEGVTIEDVEALEVGVTAAVDNLLGAVTEALRSTARDLVLGALGSTSTTDPAGAGTVDGQEDEANAGDKAGRGAKPASLLTSLELLELDLPL